jgi:gas vesicle protein
MKRLVGFLLGAASGALVGGIAAVLLAPTSGQDLRSDLRGRVNRFRDEIQDAANQRRNELERQLQSLRHPNAEIPLEDR